MAPITRAMIRNKTTPRQCYFDFERGPTVVNDNGSLCFKEAEFALNNHLISEEEYWRHISLHFTGVRHYDEENYDLAYNKEYPVQAMIRWACLYGSSQSLESPLVLEKLFAACSAGDHIQVATCSYELPTDLVEALLRPLVTMAGLRGHTEVFRILVKKSMERNGSRIQGAIEDTVFHHTELLDVLWEENWCRMREKTKPTDFLFEEATRVKPGDRPGEKALVLRWLIDHNIGPPDNVWQNLYKQTPAKDVLEVLLVSSHLMQICWHAIIRCQDQSKSNFAQEFDAKKLLTMGLMQYSAGRGEIKTVRFLVDAGADVNQVPPDFSMEDRGGAYNYRALHKVIDSTGRNFTDDHLVVAKILLDHGANINLTAKPGFRETALAAAKKKRKENPRLLQLLEQYTIY